MVAFHSAIRLALIVVSVLASSVSAARPAAVAGSPGAAPELAASRNAQWDDRFGMVFGERFDITNSGEVSSAVVFNGELYVAGRFKDTPEMVSAQGAASISTIARWNGRKWSNVGAWSPGTTVEAMLIHNGSLYVSGQFTAAGGVAANNVARWDGTSWHALGAGLSGVSPSLDMPLAVWNGEL